MKVIAKRVNEGCYVLCINGTVYAVASKCRDNTWRYEDWSVLEYHNTLRDCKSVLECRYKNSKHRAPLNPEYYL